MAEYLIPHPNVPTTDMGIPKLKESTMLFNENFLALDDQVRTNTSEIESLSSSKADADHTHDYDYAEKDHTHSIQEIESLEANLSLKAPLVHTHEQYLTEMPAHTHDQNEITNLQLDLSGKASAQHTHLIYDVSGLGSELAQKATQQQLGQVANMIVPAYGTLGDGKFVAAKTNNGRTYIETPDEQPVATTGTASDNHIVSFAVNGNTVKIKDSDIDKDDILTTDNIGDGLQVTTESEATTVSVKCAENGGLSVSANGVAIEEMTGSKWVKTDSDGMLTTTDDEPITASKSATGFIFNTTGTISHKSFGTSAGDVSEGDHNHDEEYADINHTHDEEYADINHTHDEYQEKSEKLTKLNTALDDSGKVPLTQLRGNVPGHSGICYVTIANDGTLGHSGNTAYTLLNDAANVSEVSKLLTDKDVGTAENTVAAGDHTHEDEYAAIDHDHDGVYSPVDHEHEIYALVEHNHDDVYAGIGHNHDTDYAEIDHDHSQYAETEDLGDAAYQDIGVGVQAHSDELTLLAGNLNSDGTIPSANVKDYSCTSGGDCLAYFDSNKQLSHLGNTGITVSRANSINGCFTHTGSGPLMTSKINVNAAGASSAQATQKVIGFKANSTTASLIDAATFDSTPSGGCYVKTTSTGSLEEDDFEGLSDGDPQDVGASASPGAADTAARSDHVHSIKCKSDGGIEATSDGLALGKVGKGQESTGFIDQEIEPEPLKNIVRIHWPRFDSNGRFVDFEGPVTTIEYFPGGMR